DSAAIFLSNAYQVEDPSDVADFGLRLLQRWPGHRALQYQTHRALMWAGRAEEGAELKRQFDRLHGQDVLVNARQACIEGRREDAEAQLDRLASDSNEADDSQRWLILKMLGRNAEASQVWQPYAVEGAVYSLSTMLGYSIFDPSPYPILVEALERQGVQRPAPVELPYKCPPPEQTSIAVLPFVNMSADTENEYFSDGIAEEILNVLASIPELKVAARTSAFAYKGTNTNISRIADELGVNHVLEGSVRKAGNQVRVTAQLIQASDGFHLWSDNYDRELTNIFEIQDEIADSIADALKVTLALEADDSGNLTGTTSLAAYEHYLQGMQLWHQRTVASLDQAEQSFKAAIAADPEFAKAHAGLASVYAVIEGYKQVDAAQTRQRARHAAQQALSLDPENAEALTVLAVINRYEGRQQESLQQFHKALTLNPSYATAYQWRGGLLGEMGDPEAGLESYRKARSLDPRSRIIGYNLAWRLWGLGRFDQAWEVTRAVLEDNAEFPDIVDLAMFMSVVDGQCDQAEQYARRLITILGKTQDSTAVYRDLCQREDPQRRERAVQSILSWDSIEFSDPAAPTLSYSGDLIALFIEFGFENEAWELIARQDDQTWFTLTWLRTVRTEQGIRFQCSERYQAALEAIGAEPPLNPVDC
ncbi:MAG: tetratricopeptide repeat protein, partial [Xanthomonadales bacterium]|nr:tetratricopeptide repeat protein [Xanthomonadales bacterium]